MSSRESAAAFTTMIDLGMGVERRERGLVLVDYSFYMLCVFHHRGVLTSIVQEGRSTYVDFLPECFIASRIRLDKTAYADGKLSRDVENHLIRFRGTEAFGNVYRILAAWDEVDATFAPIVGGL